MLMRAAVVAATVTTMIAVTGCATIPQPAVLEGTGLGSTWTVKIADVGPRDREALRREIQSRVDLVGHRLSRWEPASSLSVMNASPSGDWQAVPAELFSAMSYAFSLARDTGGAFDPTVAALVDVWGFGTAGRIYSPPSAEAVRAAREHVGFEKVSLDAPGLRVRKPGGMQIDLSSMQHGTGADAVGVYLESIGVRNYLVDVGSEIRARGESPEGGAWHVAIERPPAELSDGAANERHEGRAAREAVGSQSERAAKIDRDSGADDASGKGSTGEATEAVSDNPVMHVVQLRDAGIATSGNYRYYFDFNGRRYSHRIDPRTGEPVAHTLAAVTVIDPECAHADALATALTVLGPVAGLKFATARNIAALFIERTPTGLVEHMTPQFAAYAGHAP